MRVAMTLVLCSLLALVPINGYAGDNPNTTIVLHAVHTSFGSCLSDDPCLSQEGPTVSVSESSDLHTIYVLIRNYDSFIGIQCAFEWSPSWTFLSHLEDCIPGQLGSDVGPLAPGGPTAGSFSTSMNCITTGTFALVSRLIMIPGVDCLAIIESAYPFGTHIVSCDGSIDRIHPGNRGRVCVGPGGTAPCEPAVAVESATWGGVKAHYQ